MIRTVTRWPGLALPFVLVGAPALGQDARSSDDQADSASVLQEVIVTAERTESNLQKTPVAVSVVGGETMERLQISNVESLVSQVPGLKLDGNDKTQLRLALRGAFASADAPGTDQSVGYFVDGVYFGRTTDLANDFFDIERVEVLRGPQGTLWGRNVVGGAINVVTKNPKDYPEAEVKVTAGNYGRIETGGRLAGPIAGERLGGQIAFNSKNSDGYVRNLTTGRLLEADEMYSGRGKLRFVPNDSSEYILTADYFRDTSYGAARQLVYGGETVLFDKPEDWLQSVQRTDGEFDRTSWGLSLHADWEVASSLTLSSITAYHESDSTVDDYAVNPDPVSIFSPQLRVGTDELFSQELRLAGSTSRLTWQTGVYYYKNDNGRREHWLTQYGAGTNGLDRYNQNPNGAGRGMGPNTVYEQVETESYAAFAQGTYHVLDWLDATVGLRYTRDTKEGLMAVDGTSATFFLDPFTDPFAITLRKSWSDVTPKFTLSADFDDVGAFDSLLVYGTAANGYKSGGFQAGTNPTDSGATFLPESAWSYELGAKTRLLDNRAEINLALFTVEYENLQQLVAADGRTETESASANVDGLETELALLPLEGMRLTLAYAYMDGTYADDAVINGEAVGGNHLIQTPKHSATLAASYTLGLGNWGELDLNGSYGYKDGVYFQPANNISSIDNGAVFDLTKQSIVNLDVSLRWNRWTLSLWGKNLTNDEVIMRATNAYRRAALTTSEINAGQTSLAGKWGYPRTYGVSVKWSWD
jgi:iron complex outermembrane recepter protein